MHRGVSGDCHCQNPAGYPPASLLRFNQFRHHTYSATMEGFCLLVGDCNGKGSGGQF